MDIEKLIARQDKLLAEATALINKRNVSPSMLNWPIASQEARMGRLQQRIETLQKMKAEHARQIDSEIEMLSTELSQLSEKIETARRTLEPGTLRTSSEPSERSRAKGKRKGGPGKNNDG
ncbi:hypothetical protein AFK24_15530 [Pseudomonas syringae]|uniref:Uncharacterized protein n=1 Tax=Pseudomonas syringae TaxID=317 RepID=A0A1C7Z5C4_PSESX|nr:MULTISPECIES: hypothetical protein [Pseudomonas]MDR6929372.1 chromosome segregation ATPase [Pseudomonas sp. BE134]OCR24167.1 hypothetical protein AFK24_15530 [Pseudomonas syringae]